jgi:adenylate cyclase
LADALRWSQIVIDVAGDDAAKGNLMVGSPLAVVLGLRGIAKMWWGCRVGVRISIRPWPDPVG